MSREKELLVHALDRLKHINFEDDHLTNDLIQTIQKYLAQPEPEPIAWKVVDSIGEFMFSSVKPMKRSYKYDLIIPLYDSINDNPTFGDISMHTDEELDEHFRNRIDVYAEKHPTLLVRQLAERLRKEWNKIEEPDGNNIYIVTAYRFGDKHNHSYVVGAFSTKEEAIRQAKIEEEWRGGKYDCEVIVMRLNESLKYKNYEVVCELP